MKKCDRCKRTIITTKNIFHQQDNTPHQTFTLNRKRIDLCNDCVNMVVQYIETTNLSAEELLFRE